MLVAIEVKAAACGRSSLLSKLHYSRIVYVESVKIVLEKHWNEDGLNSRFYPRKRSEYLQLQENVVAGRITLEETTEPIQTSPVRYSSATFAGSCIILVVPNCLDV